MTGGASQLHGYPDTTPRVFGQKGNLVRGHIDAHVGCGLQFNHVPITLTVHDQDIRNTQRGSGF